MSDTCTCPHCNEQFDVVRYGHRLPCPQCGESIDVLPDSKLWIETPFGTIGVAGDIASLVDMISGKGRGREE